MKYEYMSDEGMPVVHFLECLTQAQKDAEPQAINRINNLYALAIRNTKGHAKKYHNRKFGGGIAFVDASHLQDFFNAMEAGLIG